MKNLLLIILAIFVVSLFSFSSTQEAQARGRYGSFRVGGYTSNGKGSHYIGGYVRSCHGWSCK